MTMNAEVSDDNITRWFSFVRSAEPGEYFAQNFKSVLIFYYLILVIHLQYVLWVCIYLIILSQFLTLIFIHALMNKYCGRYSFEILLFSWSYIFNVWISLFCMWFVTIYILMSHTGKFSNPLFFSFFCLTPLLSIMFLQFILYHLTHLFIPVSVHVLS